MKITLSFVLLSIPWSGLANPLSRAMVNRLRGGDRDIDPDVAPEASMLLEKRKKGGEDDRIAFHNFESTTKAIGRIRTNLGDGRYEICTGTMVGPRHVLTNKHCVSDQDTGELLSDDSVVFQPAYVLGLSTYGESKITKIYRNGFEYDGSCGAYDDFAILVLDTNFAILHMELHPNPETYYDEQPGKQNLYTIGYPGDLPQGNVGQRAHIPYLQHHSFTIKEYNYEGNCGNKIPLESDCDSYQGQSGSPIFAYEANGSIGWVPKIVGLLARAGPKRTVIAPTKAFSKMLEKARREHP